MTKFLRGLLITVVVFASLPQQMTRAEIGSGRNLGEIFTDCGIGGMFFQHRKWAGFAAVLNIFWDIGLTATTSELTTPDSCMGGKSEYMAMFIHDSYDSLEQDLASGEGEHLDALMDIAGYDVAGKTILISALRNEFRSIVAQEGYENQSRIEKAEALFNLMVKHAGAGLS